MRGLIAKEKGDDDPWDLKLARGGLTDLDFIAQGLALAHPSRLTTPPGATTGEVLSRAGAVGLLPEEDALALCEAYRTFNDLFQWQRLMIEDSFDAASVPKIILQRLASVAGLPNAPALLDHLAEKREKVRQVFEEVLRGS